MGGGLVQSAFISLPNLIWLQLVWVRTLTLSCVTTLQRDKLAPPIYYYSQVISRSLPIKVCDKVLFHMLAIYYQESKGHPDEFIGI